MSEFILSDEAKEEFLNLPHIKNNFINCHFKGQELVIPSGQGKIVKGIVLWSLETFKVQQSKIEGQRKRIEELESQILELKQFQETRDIAEKKIEIGARLTNHRINLDDDK